MKVVVQLFILSQKNQRLSICKIKSSITSNFVEENEDDNESICQGWQVLLVVVRELYRYKTHSVIFMKFGMRTPSLKKSIKARTTGKAKRVVKKALILGYGKKGSGWIKNPKKAAYNKVYKKTSFGIMDLFK